MKKNIIIAIIMGVMLSICACGNSNEGVDVSHSEMESGNYVENNVPEQEVEIVELTMDNWQDYYEFKVSIREERNEFDDIETLWIQELLALKDDYVGKVVNAEEVAFEISPMPDEAGDKFVYAKENLYKYDYETGEYTKTCVGVSDEYGRSTTGQIYHPRVEDMAIELDYEGGLPVNDYNITVNGNYWEFIQYECLYDVLQVKGRLHIIKE